MSELCFSDLIRHLFPQEWAERVEIEQMVTISRAEQGSRGTVATHLPLATFYDESENLDFDPNDSWAKTGHIWFHTTTRKPGLSMTQRGGRKDLVASSALSLDVDLYNENTKGHHAAKNLPSTIEEAALALGLEDYFDPSLVVFTGGGLHFHWIFDEPVIVDTDKKARLHNAKRKEWAQYFVRNIAEAGWELDTTWDCGRMWRPPGTFNNKTNESKPVEVLHFDPSARYKPSLLLGDKSAHIDVPENITIDNSDVDEADLMALRVELKKKAKYHEYGDVIEKLLKGESLCEHERDNMLQRLCSIIAWSEHGSTLDVEVVKALFTRSLSIWASEPQASKTLEDELQKIEDKFVRAQGDYLEKLREQLEKWRGLFRALGMENKLDDSDMDSNELFAIAKQHLIINYKNGYWVWDFSKSQYSRCVIASELFLVCHVSWERYIDFDPGVRTYYLNKKGEKVHKGRAKLMEQYGVPAKEAIIDLSARFSEFDIKTGTFIESTCHREDLLPLAKPDPELESFLKAFAGQHYEDFLDWIACLPDLEEPTCAMYIHGPPGCGKNMLANGLSRVFATNGPTNLEGFFGNFNSDAIKNPLLFLDEGFTGSAKELSNIFRSVISARGFSINEKYEPKRDARGAVRLLIAANNDGVLDLLSNKRVLTNEDEDAIKKRVYYMRTYDAATKWLAKYNKGGNLTKRWVEGDVIARYVLMLNRDRKVKRGSRFLVDGNDTNWHNRMAVSGDNNRSVMDWLVEQASVDASKLDYSDPGRVSLWKGGSFYVNTQLIKDNWSNNQNDKAPTRNQIQSVIRKVAIGNEPKIRINNKRFWEIDIKRLLEYCGNNTAEDIGDPDQIQRNTEQVIEGGSIHVLDFGQEKDKKKG